MVIVTGASSGIGRALAFRLGDRRLSRRSDRPAGRADCKCGQRDQCRRWHGRSPRPPTWAIGTRSVRAIAEIEARLRAGRRDGRQRRFRRTDPARSAEHRRRRADDSRQRPGCDLLDRGGAAGYARSRERASAGGLEPGRLQGPAGRVGLLCQQGRGERLHGGPADCLCGRKELW